MPNACFYANRAPHPLNSEATREATQGFIIIRVAVRKRRVACSRPLKFDCGCYCYHSTLYIYTVG
ncbi:hypothetical protein HWC16_gp010 [Salmonella phage Sepoy]|uniref:Uncharacterized protein n=1 Tax=Salmonella phage Sepoy TaxID=2565517 RepID=A0A4P8NFV3_9CAUD|nr:hypothetical protein HWC16_gp010 [Salmonella phage Sepoy]QCQ65504.1 hypothetical protein Sepoy_010 [Salmonella phage Sepoy]